jgi:hypothetical protein
MGQYMRSVILEIIILAYENADCLKTILDSIEYEDRMRVTVLDNSDKTVDIMQVCTSRDNIRYVKNKYNIGTANIMRAFEIAENSKYVWVVGCCNSFLKDGIKKICDILERDNPTTLLHLENNLHRNPETLTSAIYVNWETFLVEHSYSVACSLNSIIWKVEAVSKLLPVGYDSLTSMCPHAAMLFNGMKDGVIELSFYPISVFNRHNRKRQWSMRQHIKWIQCIFPYTDRLSQAYRDKLIAFLHFTDGWIFDLRNED